MPKTKTETKTKMAAFSLSNGIVDHLNTSTFYSRGALMIYLRIQEESQKVARAGIGEISVKDMMNSIGLNALETLESLENLSNINFATFKLSGNKNFLNEKCLNIFSGNEVCNEEISDFIFNKDSDDPYILAINFFNKLPINRFAQYIDLLFIPCLKFRYEIIKYKDQKIMKQKKQFDNEIYRVLSFFKNRREINKGNWDLDRNWEIKNLTLIRDMIEPYRKKYSLKNDGFVLDLMEDIIDYFLSHVYFNLHTGSFGIITANKTAALKNVKDLRDILSELKKDHVMKEKMSRVMLEIEQTMGFTLSPSHRRFFPLYFYDVMKVRADMIKDAIDFIHRTKVHDKNNIDLKLIAKQIIRYDIKSRKR